MSEIKSQNEPKNSNQGQTIIVNQFFNEYRSLAYDEGSTVRGTLS